MSDQLDRKQRIILVSELFYPEETSTSHILTKIIGELVCDFEILVLTSTPSSKKSCKKTVTTLAFDEKLIEQVWSPKLNKNKLLWRLAQFFILTTSLGIRTLIRSKSSDIVFTVTNPAPLLVVLAIIRKFRHFKLVFLVHDVFPENAVAAGIIQPNNIIYKLIRHVFDWAYNSADEIITIGRDMSDVIAQKVPNCSNKITLIENWADSPLVERIPRTNSIISDMGLSQKIIIQYAGNIGRAQSLLEFVDLISSAKNEAVQFIFRGSGALSKNLIEATSDCESITLEGSYSRSEQSRILGGCDISLVILGPKMYGLGVPSKTYNILASGKPILFLGPKNSEIFRIVNSEGVGWAFDWSESEQLIRFINELSIEHLPEIEARGCKARRLAEAVFTEAGQLLKFRALFLGMSMPNLVKAPLNPFKAALRRIKPSRNK